MALHGASCPPAPRHPKSHRLGQRAPELMLQLVFLRHRQLALGSVHLYCKQRSALSISSLTALASRVLINYGFSHCRC